MKTASILTQYLFTFHKLNLGGIGSLSLDPEMLNQKLEGKAKTIVMDCIHFEYKKEVLEETDLVEFISQKSNKMKSLASSDLDTLLQNAKTFLNISKPFTLEAVGTFQKTDKGLYEFTPAIVPFESAKELLQSFSDVEENKAAQKTIKQFKGEPKFEANTNSKKWWRPIILVLILAAVGFGIWKVYDMLKTTNTNKEATPVQKTRAVPTVKGNSDPYENPKKDTIEKVNTATGEIKQENSLQATHKYILEKAQKDRAFKRMAQLKSYGWNILMETKDSVTFTLYVTSSLKDTASARDSLSKLLGRRIIIEK